MIRSGFQKKVSKPLKRSGFKRPPQGSKFDSNRVKRSIGTKSRPRTKTMAQLKKELDCVFSIHIRAKYPKRCYTCGKVGVTLQCGHFVSRQYLATRWEDDNCRPQCVGCNLFGNGQLLDFEENLKRELGEETVENLKKSRHQMVKLDRQYYLTSIALYTDAK